ncbi:unnamed protein product [Protopolystoma xenopodis]|uniref:Uncharacterized protein n=1 Tax=Protopolystoma xenopodis TaxID=117903 RepID=A0A448XRK7_9PLAT|nr:unnamed protein product [Protopolystoma xenopodis]
MAIRLSTGALNSDLISPARLSSGATINNPDSDLPHSIFSRLGAPASSCISRVPISSTRLTRLNESAKDTPSTKGLTPSTNRITASKCNTHTSVVLRRILDRSLSSVGMVVPAQVPVNGIGKLDSKSSAIKRRVTTSVSILISNAFF